MKFNWLDVLLIVIGPIVLRPVFEDNTEYMIVCFIYGFALGIRKHLIESGDK